MAFIPIPKCQSNLWKIIFRKQALFPHKHWVRTIKYLSVAVLADRSDILSPVLDLKSVLYETVTLLEDEARIICVTNGSSIFRLGPRICTPGITRHSYSSTLQYPHRQRFSAETNERKQKKWSSFIHSTMWLKQEHDTIMAANVSPFNGENVANTTL